MCSKRVALSFWPCLLAQVSMTPWELSKNILKEDIYYGGDIGENFGKMTPLITEVFAKKEKNYLKEGHLV